MIPKIFEAVQALRPGAFWSFTGSTYAEMEWLEPEGGQTKPTEEEVVQKIAELTYKEEVEAYKEQRAAEYPSYADQFDKIFHSGVNAWKTQIRTIKERYPKQTMDPDVLAERKRQALEDLEASRSSEES
jgi:hypothetical protein